MEKSQNVGTKSAFTPLLNTKTKESRIYELYKIK